MSHQHSTNYNFSFALGISLNIIFVLIEATYGILSDSLALLADAGHNLSDVLSLFLAWGATFLAKKAANEKRTYGLKKVTIIASLASAMILLIALGAMTWEAIGRFKNPEPIEGMTVIIVAAIGIIINTFTALLFLKGQKDDLNIRGAFLHMAADALVSVGVVLAGILILIKGWLWIDPLITLVIVGIVLIATLGLLKDSINYAIDAVPKGINIKEVRQYLEGLQKVQSIHDLHIWPLSTTETALSVHLIVETEALDNDFLLQIQKHLHDHLKIHHSTIQLETQKSETECVLNVPHCL